MSGLYRIFLKKSTLKITVSVLLSCSLFVNAAWAKVPNDPLYQSDLWNKVNAPSAWDYTIGSKRVVVAVIDTGMDI